MFIFADGGGRGVKKVVIFCGRHKWMTPNKIKKTIFFFGRVLFQFSTIVTLNKSFKLPVSKISLIQKQNSISVQVQLVVLIYLEIKVYTTSFLVSVWGNNTFFSKSFSFILVGRRWHRLLSSMECRHRFVFSYKLCIYNML